MPAWPKREMAAHSSCSRPERGGKERINRRAEGIPDLGLCPLHLFHRRPCRCLHLLSLLPSLPPGSALLKLLDDGYHPFDGGQRLPHRNINYLGLFVRHAGKDNPPTMPDLSHLTVSEGGYNGGWACWRCSAGLVQLLCGGAGKGRVPVAASKGRPLPLPPGAPEGPEDAPFSKSRTGLRRFSPFR